MNHILTSWKSTVLGVCFLGISSLTAVHFDAAGHFAMTPKDWFTIAIGFGGAAIGAIMKDAGTTLATTPQSPVTPIAVASHEQPDDPAATPVNK